MSESQSRTIRVLHVDDEPEFADLTATYLERIDHTIDVIIETNPDDGFTILDNTDIDCVVSDYQMPGKNGIQFLEDVRKEYPNLPFILFTGKGSEEVASDAISAGVTDYLQKELGTDQYEVLANRIDNAVSQLRAEAMVKRAFRAMDRSREGIALLDEEGEFIYVNDTYTEIVGYDKAELRGEFWELVYPDEQVQRIYEDILSEVPEEGHWSGDSVYQRKDGSRVRVNHALIYSDEGTMICLLRDITDAEEQWEAVREERERFDLFANVVEEYAIFLLDPNGYVTTWNKGAERIKGYAEEDILGDHFSKFYPEEARAKGRPEQLLEQARAERSVTDTGWRIRNDGSKFWADVTITCLTDESGDLRGFGKVTRDTTERRQREETIRSTQAQFDTLPDIFYVVDDNGRFTRFSEKLVETTGYTRAELDSIHSLELVPDDDRDRFREQHEQLLKTDEPVKIESWLVTKDGSHIPHEFRRRRLTGEDGEILGFAGIARDITERKEYERQLEQHVGRLNEFASVLTHDLRNPLSAAKGHLPLVEDQLNEADTKHVEAIDQSLDRIEGIIEDVLEITRTGLPVTDPEPTDVGSLAHRMWADMETGAVHPDLTLDEVPAVMADPSLLRRLLMNLFRNSVEHGGEGGVSPSRTA